jgi:hypothetical protein
MQPNATGKRPSDGSVLIRDAQGKAQDDREALAGTSRTCQPEANGTSVKSALTPKGERWRPRADGQGQRRSGTAAWFSALQSATGYPNWSSQEFAKVPAGVQTQPGLLGLRDCERLQPSTRRGVDARLIQEATPTTLRSRLSGPCPGVAGRPSPKQGMA